MNISDIQKAAHIIKNANRVTAFTGAGISVESGIPPFRGPDGIWNKYDPTILDINYFMAYPNESWAGIKKIFYDFFGKAEPNAAHKALAKLEMVGKLQAIITQNIDNLHQAAGSKNVIEFHGNSHRLLCPVCKRIYKVVDQNFVHLPPKCENCKSVLKPDFVFFGEQIPMKALKFAQLETKKSDIWLIIGTTGEIYPAASLPFEAKQNGKTIIEINIQPSHFSHQISDILLLGKAGETTSKLAELVLG